MHEKAAKLRARVCLGGFVVDFGGNVHYSVAWTTLWLRERSGATREASAVNLTGLVRSVMQMGNAGSSNSENLGLGKKDKAASS